MSTFIRIVNKKTLLEEAGSKAYNLGKLKKYKYLTPNSCALTVEAMRSFFKHNRLDDPWLELKRSVAGNKPPSQVVEAASALRRAVMLGDVPADLQSEIESFRKKNNWLKESLLAVRSSAINEDLLQYSFAGQYSSFLNIENDLSSIIHAVKGVWASQWSESLVIYCRKNDIEIPGPEMAVLIQQMVDPQIAGVLFSRNPYNLNANEIIIEYVEGLGDALVSGEATPAHVVFLRRQRDFKNREKTVPRKLETPLRLLVNHALALEKKTGLNVDLEWALAGGQIYLLQMRPITTMGQGILWTDENVGEVIPDVVTPYSWSILNPITNNAFREFLKHSGIDNYPASGLFGLYQGKVYFNKTAFQETLNYFYPSEYLKQLSEKKAGLLKKFSAFVVIPLRIFKALWTFWRFSRRLPVLVSMYYSKHAELLKQNSFKAGENSGSALKASRNLVESHHKTMFLHISDTIFAEVYYQVLNKLGSKWLPAEYSADRLLSGLDAAESAKSGEALWHLARDVSKVPELEKAFREKDAKQLEEMLKNNAQFSDIREKIAKFIRLYGHGALHEFELLFPRWWEDRSYIYTNIANYLENPSFNLPEHKRELSRRREQLLAEALQKLGFLRRLPFRYIYKKTIFFSTHRENLKQRFLLAHSLLKKHLLRLGRHLCEEAVLEKSKDIFFLEHEEIPEVMSNEKRAIAARNEIPKRRNQRSQNKKARHPRRLIQSGEIWRALADESEETQADLSGIGCSSGLVEGTVRVIEDETMFGNMQKGEILVAHSTNPGWTPLFVSAAGIVTEIGGALSHGAIIAREYGLPMVAAVNNVTRQLKTGDRIRLNGDAGTITILNEHDNNGQNTTDSQ